MTHMTWHDTIPERWNDTLFASGGHFLQSSHWALFQESLGKQIFATQGSGWQCLAVLEDSVFGPRLYCPYGPLVESGRALKQAILALKGLAKQHGAIYIRIEPIGTVGAKDLAACGAQRAPQNVQPQYTWVKDLGRSEDDLLAEMSSTNRNLYRNTAKKDIVIRRSRDPADGAILLTMIHDVANHTGISPHSDNYYKKMIQALLPDAGSLYIAEHQGQPIAAAFMFDSPTTRYYAHAGSLNSHRNLHAGSPLVTQAIIDATDDGQTSFDFVGIAPPDEPNHRWQGFTKYKKSFGGQAVARVGTWEIPVNPIRYSLYRLSHFASRILR